MNERLGIAQDGGNESEDEGDPDIEEIQATMSPDGAIKITQEFLRKGQNSATLEDFELLKIVGKGTFGKVY